MELYKYRSFANILVAIALMVCSCETKHETVGNTDTANTDTETRLVTPEPDSLITRTESEILSEPVGRLVGISNVTAHAATSISTEKVTLLIDSGAVSRDVEISILATTEEHSGSIPENLANLTVDGAVYRMLPDGQKFEKDITIAMSYDSTALPYGYTPEDIYTFFYNEETHLWQQVERDSVDTENQIVYSRTNHFTDYINGVLKVPESNDAMAYTPTSIKDLKAADPMEGITMIAPPEANNMGTANLSYPLQIPAGRRGMQPNLAVTYNSAGGSGILGLGWSLPISEISVDTRRGVPLFDQTYETEAYVFDGEEIVTSYIDNNSLLRLNKPVYKTAWKERNVVLDTVRYYHRREGVFSRIQRIDTTTKTYSWIVTDKSGIKYYYGIDAESRLCDNKGNITRWFLSYVEDTYGNTCTYHWTKRIFTHPNLNPGIQVLLQSINYTGTNANTGRYSIRFHYSDTPKYDATVSARSGVMEADAFLLDHIDEAFGGTPIRSYYFGYKQGTFNKTLLCNIVEASPKSVEDGGKNCSGIYSYTSNPLPGVLTEKKYPGNNCYTRDSIGINSDLYADDFRILNSAGEPIFSREVYARCAVSDEKCEFYTFNEHKFEYSDLRLPILGQESAVFNQDASDDDIEGPLFMVHGTPGSIEGSGTRSWNVGGGLDVGFGYNTFLKNITLGGNYNYTNNTTEGLLMLVDLNGDGLPDKVYKRGDKCYYRLRDTDNVSRFGRERRISGMADFLFSTSYSHTWGIEGAVGTANGVNFGVNWTYGADTVKSYLTDVDGDGLPDLVKDGNVYYNRIHQYPDKVFVTAQSEVRYDTLSVCGDIVVDTVYVGEPIIPDLFEDYDNDTVYYTICRDVRIERWNGKELTIVDTVICHDTMVVNHYRAPKPYIPNLENVRLWKAPYTGYVSIKWNAGMVSNSCNDCDGVRLIVQKDMTIIHDANIRSVEQIQDSVEHIYVEQGSRIFFRMLSGETRTADRALWNPTIRYDSVSTAGLNLSDSIGTDGLNRYVYSYNKDFSLSGVQQVMMPYRSRIRLTYRASIDSSITILAPVLFTVLVNDQIAKTDTLTDSNRNTSNDFYHDVEKHDKVQILMSCDSSVNWGAIEARCRLRIVENRSSNPNDMEFACIDTQSIPGDTVFFYDYYPQIEKHAGVTSSQQDAIFGTMYRQWGQFAYKSPDGSILLDTSLLHLDSIYYLQQSDSSSYTGISEDDEFNISGNGEESNVSIGGQIAYNPLASAFFNMQPDFKNGCWSAYTDYASVGRDTLSNVPHLATTMAQEQYDSITHASLSQTYSQGNYAVIKENTHNSWGVSANGHVCVCDIVDSSEICDTLLRHGIGVNLSIGGSYTMSQSRQISDMIDLNGDGIPDVLTETKVQYSQPQGGLSLREGRHSINGYYLDSTADETTGGSFSGTAVFSKLLPSQNSRRAHTTLTGTIGANFSGMSTSGKTIISWNDINGDGLPDKLVDIDGTLHYFQNLGYGFMGDRPFSGGNGVRESYSHGTNGGASLGGTLEHEWLNKDGVRLLNGAAPITSADSVRRSADTILRLINSLDSLKYNNKLNVSISAGMNTSVSNNNTTLSYMDFNGDGLPDRLEKYNNGYIIKFNTGNGFDGGMAVLKIDADTDHVSSSTDLSAAITAGITIGSIPLKIEVNPKGGLSRSLNSTRAQWMDMNADGIPDYIWSAGNGIIGVRYSNMGLANRLQKVTLPTQGTYEIAYHLNNDGPRSGSNHYVMAELTIADNKMMAPDQHRTFRYQDRHYDRRERDDYGYSVVETSEDETLSGRSKYRSTYRHYLNSNYLFRGLCDTVRISQGDSVYTQNYYNYNLMDIATGQSIGYGPGCYGDGYPALEYESTYYYIPGNESLAIETYRSYEYGPFGNLLIVNEEGDVNDINDNFTAESVFDSIGDYIVNAVIEETVMGNGVLRHRTAIYNNKGSIDTLRFSANTGADAEYNFKYDSYGNMTRVTYPANHWGQRYFITYSYDSITQSLPTSVTNAYGLSSSTRFDYRWQKPVLSINVNGSLTEWQYDDKGRPIAVYAPFEYGSSTPTIYYDYNDSSRHNSQYWNNRHWVAYTMNHNDGSQYIRTATISDGLGRPRVVKKDFEVDNILRHVTSGWQDYDGLGRVVAVWEPTEEDISTPDTITSRPYSVYSTSYSYDVLDRITNTLFADNTTISSAYDIDRDATGLKRMLVRTSDQNGHVTKQFFDTRKLLTTTIGSVYDTTIFTYDAFGQLVKTRDPDGDSVIHFYDNLGRRTHRTHPSAGHTHWDYDPAGNMIKQTQNNGEEISYEYDYTRPVHISYSSRPWNDVWYEYGAAGSGTQSGRIVRMQDATGVQSMKYDYMGNMVFNRHTYVQPHSPNALTLSTEWKYDSWGRLLEITYPDLEKVYYHYDLGGALTSVKGFKPGVVDSTFYIRDIRYDHFGQRTYIMDGDSVETRYQYEPYTRRLSHLVNYSHLANAVLQDNKYEYDNVGNIISIRDGGRNPRIQTFSYDAANRLIRSEGDIPQEYSSSAPLSYKTQLSYSPAGKLLSKHVVSRRLSTTRGLFPVFYDNSYLYNDPNNPYAVTRIHDSYGANYDFTWDANGNLEHSYAHATHTKRYLCWTEDNRLQAFMENGDDGGIAAYYNYAADGERNLKLTSPRINIQQNAALLNNPSLIYPTLYASPLITLTKHGYTKHYFEEGHRICSKIGGGFRNVRIEEVDEHVPELKFDYGEQHHRQKDGVGQTFNACLRVDPQIDRGVDLYKMLVVQEYIRDEQEPAFYYHSDHLGSAAYLTNNGQVTQTLNYLPYGEDWVDIQHYMGARYSNMELYTFTGKERDFESGYHYFGARYYDSEALTGWLSVDPMMDKYPSLSPYAYCAWNPVKLVDPDGMKVVAYTKETQKKILGYMENLFGASSMFRFNKNGSLKINRKEFSNYYKTSTNDQKKILKGINQAIRARKTVTINIQENNSKFIWKGINEEFAVDFTLDLKNNSGCTSSEYYPVLGHIISINDRGKNASSLSAGINENGEKETIVPPTSTTFVHELLDEFLNFFVTGITNENSPNVDKVDYQNTALRILGLKERDGSDHCY